ncbi:MAG: NUDIX domain-containing protein, partial [Gammaproteobacteria bacterium]|nr:NUDIX domain-containing protein [Gammaproteobacteria bacterium]
MDKPTDIEIIAKNTVFKGFFRIDRYRIRHRRHDGTMSDPIEREVAGRGHIAAVLPVDPDRDRVVLVEQFRPGAMGAGWEPWSVECVAGIIETGEQVEDVARRESIEECGCRIEALEPVHCFLTTPGALTETVNLYCGKIDSRDAGGIYGVSDEGEDIKVLVYTVEEAVALAENGS